MPVKLAQIDANLLVALDVLLAERSVSRAATRLGITQSAMSQTLARLRDTLDDPLLVRSGRQMVATPRAEALAGPLQAALQALEQALAGPREFEPSRASRRFRVAMLDIYSVSLLPRLLAGLVEAGPGLSLEVLPLVLDRVHDQLRAGEVELAVIGPATLPADIESAVLLRERLVSMVRRGHPLLERKRVTTKAYTCWPHVVFRITGRGSHAVDERLAELGLERTVAASVPYFLAAPALVLSSDLIVTLPDSLARVFAGQWPVEVFANPVASLDYDVRMIWPNFLAADAGHAWLRKRFAALAGELGG